MMKKFTIFLMLSISVSAYSQKVDVNKKSEKVKSESADGYTTELDGQKDGIESAWTKVLKELGRVKSGSGYQYIENPTIGGTSYTSGIIYAKVEGTNDKASVWIGIKGAEWSVNDVSIVESQLEKFLYKFGVKFYRDKIQGQIDEGQQASAAVARVQAQLLTQNKNLNSRLEMNAQEKIRLEKALEANKLENLVLIQKIENNKKSQDSVKLAGEQIKRVVDMHTERQRKVN